MAGTAFDRAGRIVAAIKTAPSSRNRRQDRLSAVPLFDGRRSAIGLHGQALPTVDADIDSDSNDQQA